MTHKQQQRERGRGGNLYFSLPVALEDLMFLPLRIRISHEKPQQNPARNMFIQTKNCSISASKTLRPYFVIELFNVSEVFERYGNNCKYSKCQTQQNLLGHVNVSYFPLNGDCNLPAVCLYGGSGNNFFRCLSDVCSPQIWTRNPHSSCLPHPVLPWSASPYKCKSICWSVCKRFHDKTVSIETKNTDIWARLASNFLPRDRFVSIDGRSTQSVCSMLRANIGIVICSHDLCHDSLLHGIFEILGHFDSDLA